jgi:hypothetical protein
VTHRKTILGDPDGPNRNASFSKPLEVGMRALATIDGKEITVRIVRVITAESAEAEVIKLQNEVEFVKDLHLGDITAISRSDMKWLDVD